jgi:nucleoid-associated protein YgaU
MSIENTLFNSQGKPIRAKVALSFKAFISSKEGALRANNSSSDLTHIVYIKAEDTLPQLCYKIYGDVSYYPKVARVNNITNFRNIKLGTRLYFPPVR